MLNASIRAIIFDMDGVIIDSEHVHHDLERQMFELLGIRVTRAEHASFTGQTVWTMWSALKERFGLNQSVEELRMMKKQLFYKELASPDCRVSLIDGVVDFIADARHRGLRLAVASSSSQLHVEYMVDRFGLSAYFDGLFGGDLVVHSKPAPDLFLFAAEQLGVEPSGCLVIEDSANGVRAGKAAGMTVVGFRNPNSGEQDLSLADFVVDNYLDFPYINGMQKTSDL